MIVSTAVLLLPCVPTGALGVRGCAPVRPRLAIAMSSGSQLQQLASFTTLSIDTGDFSEIKRFAETGLITDATTNPLFVSKAGLSGDKMYAAIVDEAVAYARKSGMSGDDLVGIAMDRLAVNLGREISQLVPGYVSTEVDVRLSFDTEASVERGRRIIQMYADAGVPKERILVKLAGTWEGIRAAEQLQKEGINCNITLIFAFIQAVAAAQYGARLISPFPGRVLDWAKAKGDGPAFEPSADPGVVLCERIYRYYKKHGHDTICMPASWRPSRGGPEHALDEIIALAGADRMTIPPPLLERLAGSEEAVPRRLEPTVAAGACEDDVVGAGAVREPEFRLALSMDGCGNDKLAEGIRAFVDDTEKLDKSLRERLGL